MLSVLSPLNLAIVQLLAAGDLTAARKCVRLSAVVKWCADPLGKSLPARLRLIKEPFTGGTAQASSHFEEKGNYE